MKVALAKLKTRFSQKIKQLFYGNFTPLCYSNFMQKVRKICQTQKTHFGLLLSKNPSPRFFPKKSLKSILSLYVAVTL